jgi:pyruvate dehydrogenase E2 component (dihydrolipoamide acetyltransferase)
MGELRMPSLGADMEAGTLVAWHVRPGDAVERGAVVADVETDKGIVEIEMWERGVVATLDVQPGTRVPVGTVLATTTTIATAAPPAAAPLPAPQAPAPGRTRATPGARQLARERGLDLGAITGTGPHGSITRGDVERAPGMAGAVPPPPAPPEPQAAAPAPRATPDGSAMRRAIAAAMTRSKREIPHYYLHADLDVEAAARWLETANAARGVTGRILFAALLLRATALAAREVPEVNGHWIDGELRPSAHVHLGVAVSLRRGGLVAPAIHDVDDKPLDVLQAALVDVVARARAGHLRSSEMTDGTLTVTNLGDLGVDGVFGVIHPPQVALVGFGRVAERPWAEHGMLGVRRVVTATLSADHRASDGHRGGTFLAAIGRILAEPEKL